MSRSGQGPLHINVNKSLKQTAKLRGSEVESVNPQNDYEMKLKGK